MTVHWYSCSLSGFIDYLTRVHSRYGNRPVWVTEFSCPKGTPAQEADFLR